MAIRRNAEHDNGHFEALLGTKTVQGSAVLWSSPRQDLALRLREHRRGDQQPLEEDPLAERRITSEALQRYGDFRERDCRSR
jgi:hypothetical protein